MIRKFLCGALLAVLFAHGATAQTIDQLGAGSAVSATDIFPAFQGANPAKGVTGAQIKTFTGDQTGWTPYTPTLSCAGGALTTATAAGRWKALPGKTVEIQAVISVTAIGTCAGTVLATLPAGVTANSTGSIYPLNTIDASTNAAVVSYTQNGNLVLFFASAIAANNYFLGGSFESN